MARDALCAARGLYFVFLPGAVKILRSSFACAGAFLLAKVLRAFFERACAGGLSDLRAKGICLIRATVPERFSPRAFRTF